MFRGVGVLLITVTGSMGGVDIRINGGDITDISNGTKVVRLGRLPESSDNSAMRQAKESRDAHRRNLRGHFDLTRLLHDRSVVLIEELDALEDLLGLVRKGALHHLPGVAVSLRKLVTRGKGNQILRDIASILRQQLIVYAGPGATRFPEGVPLPTHHLTKTLAGHLTPGCTRRTDLESWLSETGYSGGGLARTNEQILSDIADKIGAHSDYDVGKLVTFLRQLNLGGEQGIINFLLMVADVTLSLGRALLDSTRQV